MKTVLSKGLLVQVVLIAFCFLSKNGTCQPLANDSIRIHELYEKSRKHWRQEVDSALYYLEQMDRLSKETHYERGEAYALYAYGINEKVLFKEFEFYTRSLQIFEELQDQFGIGLTLLKIGNVYDKIGQQEKALEYYQRALEVKKKLDDAGGIALTLINIGKYYQAKDRSDLALKYFDESLIYRLKEGTHQGIAYVQINKSEALYSLNQFNESLAMADSSIRNFSYTSDVVGQMWSLYQKGICLKKLNQLKEAEKIFEAVTQFANEKTRFYGTMLRSKRELVEIYFNRGDTKKAFLLQSEYLIAKDTLDKRDYRIETQRLANEYEFTLAQEKAKREQQAYEEQIARRNNLEYLSISIVVLLIFVVLFSGRKKLSMKIVNISLLIGLLLLFEFLLILTDSSVDKMTKGEPLLKLITNVVLALLILPGHQFLEKYSKRKLAPS